MTEKPMQEDYPYNLLIVARGKRMLELPLSLTKNVYAGIAYALSLLEEEVRDVLKQKYHSGMSLSTDQQKIERKALEKLRFPSRWDYIRYGVAGCVKKKVEEAKRKGYIQGYHEGYAAGTKLHGAVQEEPVALGIMDLPLETMSLSPRVRNALYGNGCRIIRDVAAQNITAIRRIRNLGEKGIAEVLCALHSYGLMHTEWELF